MDRGYVKLWRKSLDSAAFSDPILWKLWCLCLMRVNYKKRYISVEGVSSPIEVLPGQFITGRFALHKEFYPRKKKNQKSPSTLWNRLQILQNMQNLNIKSHNKYSIITISNWEQYQQNEQQPNNNLTTTQQQPNTDKKVKKVKNKDYMCDFEDFWKVYPKKVNKKKAFEAWKKTNEIRPSLEDLLKVVRGQAQSKDWKKDGGQFIPHPSTWLNGKRWEDEAVVVSHDDDPPYW